MNLWPVEHFFPQFGVPVYCKVPQIEEKKCSTGLRFIRKEVTSYKIHTLDTYSPLLVYYISGKNPANSFIRPTCLLES